MADTVSVLTGGSNNFATTAEHLNGLATDILSEGVVGTIGNTAGVAPATGALACNAQGTPNMTVAVTAGIAYVTTTPTSQGSQLLRANIAAQNATIAANSTGGTRYDWIYVSMSASGAANPAVDGTGVATITVSRSTSSSTDNGTPPTYGYNLAVVTVANGASSITNGNITDRRSVVSFSATGGSDGWLTAEATPDTITANGNRSYNMVFNSLDLTDTLSSGMRLKLTRTVTAPTLCTDLENGSSQYYSKTTPAGCTFTDDFVCSAWVKLESYTAGTIISRYNGTSGWDMRVTATGTIEMYGVNGGAANYSAVASVQSLPLNRWVHVAAQLDMSAFTATTTTSYVMFDGVDVPATVARGGTNPTALIQAGNLEVGSRNAGTFFDGKLAQVAVYSAKVLQATILASIDRTLTGSETSLVSAYSFNNSITDLNTSNANNLTASGSAVATATDTPFAGGSVGTTEYAIIVSASFSTNTTLVIQVPEGYAIPTTGGISAMSYSTQKVPYGFPASRSLWRIITHSVGTNTSVTFGAINTWTAGNFKLNIPIGSWLAGYSGGLQKGTNVAAAQTAYFLLAPATPTNNVFTYPLLAGTYNGASVGAVFVHVEKSDTLVTTAATSYILYASTASASGTETWSVNATIEPFTIFADCAYL